MATFSTSFGSKEAKARRACAATRFTHRNPLQGATTLASFEAGSATVRIFMDGDTCAVITLRHGRMDGLPSFTKGKGARDKAIAQGRLLAKTLASAERSVDPRSQVARYTDNLLASLRG